MRAIISLFLVLITIFVGGVQAANSAKILRVMIPVDAAGFDPAKINDFYSVQVIQAIFEPLYNFDYLARPAKIIPYTATDLPKISKDGKIWTIKLKKGIYFSPDPAFGDKQRELTVADYVYGFMRMVDPTLAGPNAWLFSRKIKGLDELIERGKETGEFNLHARVPGFEIVDPYTLKIHLIKPDHNFLMMLTFAPAMAHEVVDRYKDAQGAVMNHPVGTGPYVLSSWRYGTKIVLHANSDYRLQRWNFIASPSDFEAKKVQEQMQGKLIPQIGRIEISVMQEPQQRWLAFQSGQLDYLSIDGSFASKVLSGDTLLPNLSARGVSLARSIYPEINIWYWNMRDPVVGGMSPEKIALRRALAMALNVDEVIKIVENGQAQPLQFPIPPGVVGFDPAYRSSIQHNLAAAKLLLERFGYKIGADGWRTLPDGRHFTLDYTVVIGRDARTIGEIWKHTLDQLHIRMNSDFRLSPDVLKAEKECLLQMRLFPWQADYPDGDNFMMVFTTHNIHSMNGVCYSNPEYDALYQKSVVIPDGPDRQAIYHKMARLLEVDSPFRMGYARYQNTLVQPRILGYVNPLIISQGWMYLDTK